MRPLIMISMSLPAGWYARFERRLFGFSYEEIVTALLEVTSGRVNPQSPFEIEIDADLSVRVCASPRVRAIASADAETREAVERLERDLLRRDDAIRRITAVIVAEQQAFLRGERCAPRALELDALAAEAGTPRSIVERSIDNKRVLHPRGWCWLRQLVQPDDGPANLAVLRKPKAPLDPAQLALDGRRS